jgi:hypothetical protein
MTMTAEGQKIEDLLAELAEADPGADERAAVLADVDRRLASRDIPFDEWEVLFRERLQVERDLLTGVRPGTANPASPKGSSDGRRPRLPVADPIGLVAALVGMALMALNAVLLIAERRKGHERTHERAR